MGMKASHVGEAVVRVRDTWAAARRLVEAARNAGGEFILVTGHTVEASGADRGLVQKEAT